MGLRSDTLIVRVFHFVHAIYTIFYMSHSFKINGSDRDLKKVVAVAKQSCDQGDDLSHFQTGHRGWLNRSLIRDSRTHPNNHNFYIFYLLLRYDRTLFFIEGKNKNYKARDRTN